MTIQDVFEKADVFFAKLVHIRVLLTAQAGRTLLSTARKAAPLDAWVTKDGRVIKIVDMDDHHLICSVNMLLRQARAIAYSYAFAADRYVNSEDTPDGASMAAEAEALRLYEATIVDLVRIGRGHIPRLQPLIDEVNRRHLWNEVPGGQFRVPSR